MPGSFRRAHLRGSDELFRPTRPDDDVAISPGLPPRRGSESTAVQPHADEALGVQRLEGRLLRLTDEEIDILVDAIQKQKYPTATKVPTKPPMDVYERLEELRQKLLGQR
jgi:hypothetical protein